MSDSEKEEQPVAKKRGRPSTGGNSAAKKRPADAKSSDEPTAKKGRGRPKGSVKKKRGKPKTGSASSPTKSGKSSGRGRPKKNAPKKDSTEDEEASDNGNSSEN